jgi:Rod binding domain-containing protein
LIDGGRSEEIYTSLMDAELAKKMAGSGGLGLSAILLEQMGGPAAALRKKGPDPGAPAPVSGSGAQGSGHPRDGAQRLSPSSRLGDQGQR